MIEIDYSIPADGAVIRHPDRCPICGPANPRGTGLTARREGDQVVCEVTLPDDFEGFPGRAHGGIVAALFDDATAYAIRLTGERCFAVDLHVSYRAPTPIGVPIEIRAWIERRDGRKVYTKAVAVADGVTVAEATCLKLVTPERSAAG